MMDSYACAHLDLWIRRTYGDERYDVILDRILRFLADGNDDLPASRSWPEILLLAERWEAR